MSDIRPATAEDLPLIGRTLARAFEDDPMWRLLVPRRVEWERRAARFFARHAKTGLQHGTVYVNADRTGAALWAPPDKWRTTPTDLVRETPASVSLIRWGLPRALRMLGDIEKAHPKEPHHYLHVLGTDPAHQGEGIGSALVTHVTEQADVEGLPCYLESSKESNVAFYARHGFEVVQRLELTPTASVWPMWREPRT